MACVFRFSCNVKRGEPGQGQGASYEGREREIATKCVGIPTQLQTGRRKGLPSWGWRKDGIRGVKGRGIRFIKDHINTTLRRGLIRR